MGWWADAPARRRSGQRTTEIGLLMFLGFAAFFELALNLSGFWWRQSLGATAFAILLMLVWAYLLLRQDNRELSSWH
jgi:hypothetical protein